LATVQAYSGLSLPFVFVAITTVTAGMIVAVLLLPPGAVVAAPIVGAAIFARWLASRLGRGLLIALPSGLRFVPFDVQLMRPRVEGAVDTTWDDVDISLGFTSHILVADRRVQVGPRNRAFAERVAEVGRAG
jgi:hypothetical protein